MSRVITSEPDIERAASAVRRNIENRVRGAKLTMPEVAAWARLFGVIGDAPLARVAELVNCGVGTVMEARRRVSAAEVAGRGDDQVRPTLKVVIRRTVEEALVRHAGNIDGASVELGLSRYALGRLIRRCKADLVRPPTCRDEVFDLVSDGNVWTMRDIFAAIHRGDVYVAVKRLVAEGSVERVGRGKIRRKVET